MGSEIWAGIYLVARQLGKKHRKVRRNHPIKTVSIVSPPGASLPGTQ